MSIVAGFKCCDGVLLCSDTKYSGKMQTSDGPKLWLIRRDNPVVVFGGASDHVGALIAARDRIGPKLRAGMSIERVIDIIDGVLLAVSRKFPSPTPFVSAIVGIRVGRKTGLFFNEPGDTSLSAAYNAHVSLGVSALGDYLAAKLFREGMSLQWTKVVAAHLVAQCKAYASGYCGGQTHLFSIPDKGSPDATTHENDIAVLESYLDGIDAAYEAILPVGSPMESDPDESLRGRAREIKKAIDVAANTVLYLDTTTKPSAEDEQLALKRLQRALKETPHLQRSKGSK